MQQKTIPLVMPCPGINCPDKRATISEWEHASCFTQVFLKGNGNLLCKEGCTEKSICQWRFACARHQGEYRKPDFNALIDALGTAIRSTKAYFRDDKEGLQFLAEVQKNVFSNM